MRGLPPAILAVLLATAGAALAQSNPFDGFNSRGRPYSDPALYAQQKEQWLARVQALPDVDVLEGAADFFMILDRAIARDLLERASAIEPKNPRWLQKLAQLHRLNASSGDVTEAILAFRQAPYRGSARTSVTERSDSLAPE